MRLMKDYEKCHCEISFCRCMSSIQAVSMIVVGDSVSGNSTYDVKT